MLKVKNKLSNNELRAPLIAEIKDAVQNLLYKNPETGKKIVDRVLFNGDGIHARILCGR